MFTFLCSRMISSDSESYYTPYQMVERYMNQPSQHVQEGEGAREVEGVHHMSDEEDAALPAFNISEPHDYDGSPVSGDQYMKIPLSDQYSDMLSIYIKRTSFISKLVDY
jgi:hypothetical protein